MENITLGDAIAQVEANATKLASADNEQAATAAKYASALAAKQTADAADADAVAAFNTSLEALIASATAAKVIRTPAA